jgi:hypothetical protein
MRISDLLASEVRRADGTSIGQVREVRIVQDGPIIGGLQAGFRVDALLVGKRSLGVRLGYHAGNIHGPWLLAMLFGRSSCRITEVPMTDVDTWDHEQRIVTLRTL